MCSLVYDHLKLFKSILFDVTIYLFIVQINTI